MPTPKRDAETNARALAAMDSRALVEGPTSGSDERLAQLWGAEKTASGMQLTTATMMTFSAYFNAIRIISEDMAKLPLHLYERQPDGGRVRVFDPIELLLQTPNEETHGFTFRETMQGYALSNGNAYAEIVRNGGGEAVRINLIEPPHRTRPFRTSDGRLMYEVQNAGGKTTLPVDDVLHVRGFGDSVLGYSVAKLARESIGLGLAAERFGAKFFGKGAHMTGVLMHPGELGEEGMRNLRTGWGEMYAGPDNQFNIAVLEEGMKWERIGIPPEDAQFLQTRQFQVTDVARWFRIPPHKLGDLSRATFSNIEQQSLDYVTDALLAWAKRWEVELWRKLIPTAKQGSLYFEHSFDALLKGDTLSRFTAYQIGRNIGVLSKNEIRRKENLPGIGPQGDKYDDPLNANQPNQPGAESAPAQPTETQDE